MRWSKRVVASIPFLLGAALVVPKEKESWDTPFQQWTQAQAVKMFNQSPWVEHQTYSLALGGTGTEGQNEINNAFTVRLLSALPVREAYLRILQVVNKYETMSPDNRQKFDAHFNGLLTADVSQQVVVAVTYSTNLQRTRLDLKRFFEISTTETLSQSAYLYGPRGRVDLAKYIPPENDAIGARFIFPRVVKGRPLLEPDEKELRFELWVGPIGQKLLVGFEGRKMVYKGELSY